MSTSKRFELVDALRGFALIGIMLVHVTEEFAIEGTLGSELGAGLFENRK